MVDYDIINQMLMEVHIMTLILNGGGDGQAVASAR